MDHGEKRLMDKNQESLFVRLIPFFERYGILLLILIMIAVLHLLQPDVFLSWRNVTNIFKQVSWQSMLALGVFMVIVTAGIDSISWFNYYVIINGTCYCFKSRNALVRCHVSCTSNWIFVWYV